MTKKAQPSQAHGVRCLCPETRAATN